MGDGAALSSTLLPSSSSSSSIHHYSLLSKTRASTTSHHHSSPSSSIWSIPRRRQGRRGISRMLGAAGATLEQPGGKMVVELVGAFNELTERLMNTNKELSTSSSHILFKSLKLSIPILLTIPPSLDGRSPLSRALSLALLLADLQVYTHLLISALLLLPLKTQFGIVEPNFL